MNKVCKVFGGEAAFFIQQILFVVSKNHRLSAYRGAALCPKSKHFDFYILTFLDLWQEVCYVPARQMADMVFFAAFPSKQPNYLPLPSSRRQQNETMFC